MPSGSFRGGTPFPLLKCLGTHFGRHCEPFSGQNALYCRIVHIQSLPLAPPPEICCLFSRISFTDHIQEKINKAYRMISVLKGIIYIYMDCKTFI